MDTLTKDILIDCSHGSDEARYTFPEVVTKLMGAGVESYYADFRRSEKVYYMPDGETLCIPAKPVDENPAITFDAGSVQAAIRSVQRRQIDYLEFCRRVIKAGCVSYIVSLTGRRAVYLGRTGESYVEPFPPAR